MKKSTRYDIIVLSDRKGSQRHFNITRRTLVTGVSTLLVGAALLLGLGFYLFTDIFQDAQSSRSMATLKRENDELKVANDRYLEATIDMERRLSQFEEKTAKLATMIGVESSGTDVGIGGPDLLDNELNQYLRYDLGLLKQKSELMEQRLEALDDAYAQHADVLDRTPSVLPARGWISSGYKYRVDPFTKKKTWHNGIDISGPRGTPIYAPAKGVVTYKGFQGGFGNLLEITHGDGLKTKYGHLDRFNVSKGQRVKRGDLIGYVGSTGRSTAPHLHYEIHQEDKSINPMKYIIRDVKAF